MCLQREGEGQGGLVSEALMGWGCALGLERE